MWLFLFQACRPCVACLFPLLLLQALLRISSLTECLRLLDAQMGKDPSLMLVLEEAVRTSLEGRSAVLTHYLPAYTSTGIQRPGNQDLRTWGMSRKSLEANGPGGFVQVRVLVEGGSGQHNLILYSGHAHLRPLILKVHAV